MKTVIGGIDGRLLERLFQSMDKDGDGTVTQQVTTHWQNIINVMKIMELLNYLLLTKEKNFEFKF